MSSKSQRQQQKKKKQKQKDAQRKRLKERQRKRGGPTGSGTDLRIQLQRPIPQAWKEELAEDVAVFDDATLASLPDDLQAQVSSIRESLEHAHGQRFDSANDAVSSIPRRSPLSQWRLFIRGLTAWLQEEWEQAEQAWERLKSERRPARIAIALMSARCADLPKSADKVNETDDRWLVQLDRELLAKAKLVRRLRFDREAIRSATAGTRVSDGRDPRIHISPQKIQWLQSFATEFREIEPELVRSLEGVALERAFNQPFSDLFEDATKAFIGPKHDPKNLLLSLHYYEKFDDDVADQRTSEALSSYLKNVSANKLLPEPLRRAIKSEIHVREAIRYIEPQFPGMPSFLYRGDEDEEKVRYHFREAAKAYPAHRVCYVEHANWINSKIGSRMTKKEREPHEKALREVMELWADGVPTDSEPRLWLIDHLLEKEEVESVKKHVDWVEQNRVDDPQIRAVPWKVVLLEVMRLCRRKTMLADVPERLARAGELWPPWLSKQWYPYIEAAYHLRRNDFETFERLRQEMPGKTGIDTGTLADSCMMLGAGQRMHLASEDLKPMRSVVDKVAKQPNPLPTRQLVDFAGFSWDLHRTKLLYPAYRMHGSKFAKELMKRFNADPSLVLGSLDSPTIQRAVLMLSEHRFLSNSYSLRLPDWMLLRSTDDDPVFAASRINAFLATTYRQNSNTFASDVDVLRDAIPLENDIFLRSWYKKLVTKFDETESESQGSMARLMQRMMERAGQAGIDNDDDLDYVCDCPDCRAARGEL